MDEVFISHQCIANWIQLRQSSANTEDIAVRLRNVRASFGKHLSSSEVLVVPMTGVDSYLTGLFCRDGAFARWDVSDPST